MAAAVAAAIHTDPTLAGSGVTAQVQGGQIAVTGTLTSFVLDDPGLLPFPIAVPGLEPLARLLAAAALALAVAPVLRRRADPRV